MYGIYKYLLLINYKIIWCNYILLGIFFKVYLFLNVVLDKMDNLEIKKYDI